MAIDPVCLMEVDPKKAKASSVYAGHTYHFCALSCKMKFDQDPETYIVRLKEKDRKVKK